MSDLRSREELVAEALRLLDLANGMPADPVVDDSDGYGQESIEVLRGLERDQTTLYPVQDGPGAGNIIEVTVRIMVGMERSTLVVTRGRDEPFLLREVRDHGHELDGIGAAVEAALRDALPA